jgi:hypothetical protein
MALPRHPPGPPMTLGNMRHVGKAVPEDQRNEKKPDAPFPCWLVL